MYEKAIETLEEWNLHLPLIELKKVKLSKKSSKKSSSHSGVDENKTLLAIFLAEVMLEKLLKD